MTIQEINRICKNSFSDLLGITITEFGGDTITGKLKITPVHQQPQGFVHGGVYLSLAETIAGAGSLLLLHKEGKAALGNSVNSQHLAAAREGELTCTGTLRHKGIFKHIWDVEITDDSGKLISISRVSNSIKSTGTDQETTG
jgi:1,4-dihydroxy-2-naphthoyl-CoA hydrolase